METPSDGQRFKIKDKPAGERPDVCPVPLNANAPGVGRATPTEQDREQARDLCCGWCNHPAIGYACDWRECDRTRKTAEALAVQRERNQEVRLKYCPTHRTIVPAFKDHRLSCCVLADEQEVAGQRVIRTVNSYVEERAVQCGDDPNDLTLDVLRKIKDHLVLLFREPPPKESKDG